MEDLLAAILDGEKWNDNRWNRFCDLMIRTVCQRKMELAEKFDLPEREFDFTIAFAVWGKERCGFFHNIQMTVGKRIKRSGIEYSFHHFSC
jgi:hypothetical protein